MVLGAGLMVLLCVIAGAYGTPASGMVSTAAAGLFFSAGPALLWMIGWYCGVRVGPAGVVFQ